MIILFVVCSPLAVSAQTYEVEGTDMTITIDDSIWYVFTRDNLAGNPELDELGLSYDMMMTNMQDQNIYVDACRFYTDGDSIELLVIKNKDNNYVNMSNYEEDDILKIGNLTFKDMTLDDEIYVYENDYKFFVAEYTDNGVNLFQYVTIINGYSYSFQFQSLTGFTEEKKDAARKIMDDVLFDVDTSLKEKGGSAASWLLSAVIAGAVIAGAGWGAGMLVQRIKKRRQDNGSELPKL